MGAGICLDSACTGTDIYTGDVSIRDAGIDSTDIAGTYVRRACIGGACTDNTYAKGAVTEFAFDKTAYVETICAVKHLEIYSQSF